MTANIRIGKLMTRIPHTINSEMPLKTARDMMKKFRVRHLPVQVAGHLVGVVSDRDLKLALSFPKTDALAVEDIMVDDPFAVSPETPLREVVNVMADKKYGCAIVQNDRGRVIGIFTATDGLKAFSRNLSPKRKASRSRKGG